MIYPKSKVTVSALTVKTEITEEDEGDPRIMEVSLHDDGNMPPNLETALES